MASSEMQMKDNRQRLPIDQDNDLRHQHRQQEQGKEMEPQYVITEMDNKYDLAHPSVSSSSQSEGIEESLNASTSVPDPSPTSPFIHNKAMMRTDITTASAMNTSTTSMTGILKSGTEASVVAADISHDEKEQKRPLNKHSHQYQEHLPQQSTMNKRIRMSVSWETVNNQSAAQDNLHPTSTDTQHTASVKPCISNHNTPSPSDQVFPNTHVDYSDDGHHANVEENETLDETDNNSSENNKVDANNSYNNSVMNNNNIDSESMPASKAIAPSSSGSISPGLSPSSSSFSSNHGITFPNPFPSPRVPPPPPCTPNSEYLDSHQLVHTNASSTHNEQHMFQESVTPTPTSSLVQNQTTAGTVYGTTETPSSAPTAPSGNTHGRKHMVHNRNDNEDFSEWAVGDRYQLLRILGRGSYGEVAQAKDLFSHTHSSAHIHSQSSSSATSSHAYPYQAHDTITQTQHENSHSPDVAIKRITSAFDQEVDAVRIYREMHILRRLRGHSCIIQLLDVVPPADFDSFNDLYLVFEYVDTDLYKLIMSPQYLTTEHVQTFLYQLLSGLKYIHSSSVIHRDLKPANILLNEDCSLKICDFGLARIVNDTPSLSMSSTQTQNLNDSSIVGSQTAKPKNDSAGIPTAKVGLKRQLTKHVVTRWYRAPELILIQPYTSAVDIWSLGCILAELLSMQEGSVPGYQDRAPLFPGGSCYPLSGDTGNIKDDERLDQLSVIFGVIGTPKVEDVQSIGQAKMYLKSLKKTSAKPFETMFPAADPDAIDLLKRMLQFNPNKRCTAEEALDHDFLKSVRRKELEKSADQPLTGPDFLEKNNIDLEMLKRRTYEEVLWYKERGI